MTLIDVKMIDRFTDTKKRGKRSGCDPEASTSPDVSRPLNSYLYPWLTKGG